MNVIHKRIHKEFNVFYSKVKCSSKECPAYMTSFLWNKVTCKKCLQKKVRES